MAFYCRVERDSVNEKGDRLTSFVITFPRIVLAEAVTHRMNYDTWDGGYFTERTTTVDISKNSASSRAIPFERMLQKVKDDPFVPRWTANQKGMQGGVVESQEDIQTADSLWLSACKSACDFAEALARLNIHKQDVNRLLEPFSWVTQIVTSSRWDNFFALRCHEAAHPALRTIARMMYVARRKSAPVKLEYGQWHLPFVDLQEQMDFDYKPCGREPSEALPKLIKFSAARCGWVSYENHDRDGSEEALLRTYARFFESGPAHGSPLEHQATPFPDESRRTAVTYTHQSNLIGWIQARKLLYNEAVKKYEPSEEEVRSWGVE